MKDRAKLRELHKQKLLDAKSIVEDAKATKRLHKELKAEYKDASSNRRREIRIILGKATLRDLLGDAMPVKVCKHCGHFAMTEEEAHGFKGLTCNDCVRLLAKDKDIIIVGPHSLLADKPKVCVKCGEGTSFQSNRHKVCEVCLGTTIVLPDGVSSYKAKQNSIKVTLDGVEYSSISIASTVLKVPYSTLYYKLIKGQI